MNAQPGTPLTAPQTSNAPSTTHPEYPREDLFPTVNQEPGGFMIWGRSTLYVPPMTHEFAPAIAIDRASQLMDICAELEAHMAAARARHPHLFARANAVPAAPRGGSVNGLRRW